MKCKICNKYNFNTDECSLCDFEFSDELYWNNDDEWDILNLDDDYEWSYLQIQYRLKSKNIECLFADMWTDENMAYIIGVMGNKSSVAEALGVHEEVIYDVPDKGIMLINLFQEKYIRGVLE